MKKTFKIKLSTNMRASKKCFLDNIYNSVQNIANDYLSHKKNQIETKIYDYDKTKEKYQQYKQETGINTAIIQQTMRHIDSIIKSYISWCKKKHKLVNFPNNIACPILLRNDCFKLTKSNTKHFDYWLRFCKINFPTKSYKYFDSNFNNFIKIRDSKITKKSATYFLHLTMDVPIKKKHHNNSIGIDLGIEKPIVCSTGKMFGNGKYIKHKKNEFKKKHRLTNKQFNWQTNYNHMLSKQLIDYLLNQEIGVLALEKLKGNHLSNKKFRKHPWAFKQLLNFINYKAIAQGIKVINVDPAYTSQTCNCCGSKEKSNRKNRSNFSCTCGNIMHADINAARNILIFSDQNGQRDSWPGSIKSKEVSFL